MIPQWLTHNRLYDLARSGQRLPPWWAVILVGLFIAFGSQLFALPIVFMLFLAGIIPITEESALTQPPLLSGLGLSLQLMVAFGAMILFTWLWIRFYERRSFTTLGFERGSILFLYGRGLLIGLAAFTATVGLMALLGYIAIEDSDPAQVGLAALGGVVLVFFPGWLIQGAAEEIVTRGWMLPTLSARYRVWVGLLISSLFFAFMHALNPNMSVLAMINLALYGLFGALYALREESLWGICAFHSIWNWAQGNLFGLQVSGQMVSGGMIFNLVETGPDWFTGGAFGPEGGLVTTIVLLLSIAIIWWWPATGQRVATQPVTADRAL
ncbi:MAG TPA: CPBP family intramembrane metalloprotease [Chloroflexus aurantiacus]|uniref:Abortive infection protein n=1 Tax=Chloroflexus aurantiacus (strain ATCC 29366 / DSM 635 / J-10-fl) TaxID=324602 RepID=A9WIZ4_CHLAA|nr:type II CAAX endopeptidase family protein [Chloroflexus aurantiacus]ABY36453.1 Abortive infection protein [Chloroflexus aurantiacus J-10-fl]HBW68895.1 CPBP family intramembrane metalloprotease [Chloroflexus aurantiacus]